MASETDSSKIYVEMETSALALILGEQYYNSGVNAGVPGEVTSFEVKNYVKERTCSMADCPLKW